MSRKAPVVTLSTEARTGLERLLRRSNTAQKYVLRARIALLAAEGRRTDEIAETVNCSRPTVILWRRRVAEQGLDGLRDAPRPGRPPRYGEEQRQKILAFGMQQPPEGEGTHWSTRRAARRLGVTQSAVQRVWRAHRLQPHRAETFKFSRDPQLESKVIDVVGLYLHPPANAVVLCIDEKSQIQALERTSPMLPLRPGLPARQTHDYRRHGTVTLFAALNTANGRVVTEFHQRHRHQEVLSFLKRINREYPRKQIHIIWDNYSTHKHDDVEEWLGKHPRFQSHFTPTSASWMNQVETFFSILTGRAVRRGSFRSVKELVAAIQHFVNHYNEGAEPFTWTKTAEQILAKARRRDT